LCRYSISPAPVEITGTGVTADLDASRADSGCAARVVYLAEGIAMTRQATDARSGGRWLGRIGAAGEDRWTAPGLLRRLQLALAGIWLLDAILQFQAFMFTRGFAQMLRATAPRQSGGHR
jgi:hypothetical protein